MSRILRTWTAVCAIVASALVLSQLLEIPHRSALRGYDNTFNYLWLRSAMVDRDWDFKNDLEQCDTLTPEYREHALALPKTANDRIPNKYGVGWAVITLPFYIAGDLTVRLGRAVGLCSLANDGFNPVYQIWIQLGQVALALASLWLAVATLSRWFGDRGLAVAAVVTVWAASPLLYYQTCDVSMSHGVAFFAIAALAYALTRVTQVCERAGAWVGGWWVLAGAAFGLAVTTRFQLAVFGVVLVGAIFKSGRDARAPTQASSNIEVERTRNSELATWNRSGFRGAKHTPAFGHPSQEGISGSDPTGTRNPESGTPNSELRTPNFSCGSAARAAALIVFGAAPFVALQMLAWHSVYGRWVVFGYGAEGEAFHWRAPHWSSLISPWHGLYYWHPFLLVGTVGLIAWARSRAREALPWVLAVALTMYVNAAWWCWWYGSAFGNRAFDAALLPVMAGAAWLLLRATTSWRRLYWIAAISAGTWNFYTVVLYRAGAISRSEPVTWGDFWQAVVRLPSALHF